MLRQRPLRQCFLALVKKELLAWNKSLAKRFLLFGAIVTTHVGS
jgi:hypothetical protein